MIGHRHPVNALLTGATTSRGACNLPFNCPVLAHDIEAMEQSHAIRNCDLWMEEIFELKNPIEPCTFNI
ncbi:hypothetical protein EYC84_004535 [Monilinia fructicola]|uniref:Uncharacterized protein n=1 Tax=Monilinia fructicola TaxID=38448 RepID=A0A5M9K3L3_MONFR|nr:hypothetical protein EYC84_004535 [Monilinia fructicola]